MPYARRTDAPHAAVIQALRKCGWEVVDTSRLPHFVDAVAARQGQVRLIEIKGVKGKLNPGQQAFSARFPVVVIRSVDEALQLR